MFISFVFLFDLLWRKLNESNSRPGDVIPRPVQVAKMEQRLEEMTTILWL